MARKPPRRTRENILAAALRLFNHLGEPHVSTQAIADEAGISPGNLHYHFRHREAIVEALFGAFEQEIEPLLEAAPGRDAHFEDAWLFLHLLFETLWRHRFLYRDLPDLLSRHRLIARRMPAIIAAKTQAATRLCQALAVSGRLRANEAQIALLAANMAMVTTWWLAHEQVTQGPRPGGARQPGPGGPETAPSQAALARGASQVLVMLAPWLDDEGRALSERLAREYLATRP